MNNGFEMPSWYDLTGNPDRFQETCKGLVDSKARIDELINDELKAGMPPDRVVVCGFSQGGALSLVTGLQHDAQLAGVLVMSGYLAGAQSFKLAEKAKKTPVLHLHGTSDAMVAIELARETQRRVVEDYGHENYVLKEYAGLEHTVSMEELADAIEFLQRVVP
jgi:lysophospholipase-2